MAMSFIEFQERDNELLEKITCYQMQSSDFKANIAHNEKEILQLELERAHLRHEYAKGEMGFPQRNLQGETINKTN